MIYRCEICGKEFESREGSRYGIKYCSPECRYVAFKRYINERAKRKRSENLQHNWKSELSKRHINEERLIYILENQQTEADIPKDAQCWLCGTTENLLTHHVKYYPIVEVKTLCRSCHEFVHKVILKGLRCKPR